MSNFFRDQGEEMLYAQHVGLAKDQAYPLKPPSSQVTRLHPGKAKSYEPKTLNETMLHMKDKKSITISHIQQRTTPISIHILTKEKEWGHEKRGDPHQEQEKVN